MLVGFMQLMSMCVGAQVGAVKKDDSLCQCKSDANLLLSMFHLSRDDRCL